MALSTGQINDAYQNALGRMPTGDELQRHVNRGDLEGSPGQNQLIRELGGTPPTPGGAGGAPSGSTSSVADIAKQMYELANQFRQPALTTLQESKAGIAPVYAGLRTTAEQQKPLLESRYQALLADITGETRKGVTQEMTSRGIPISSARTQDIIGQRVSGPIAQAGLMREQGMLDIDQLLATLAQQQLGSELGISGAQAQIQAGASPEAIQSALSIFGTQEQSRQAEASRQVQQALAQQQAQAQAQQFSWEQEQAAWQQPFQEAIWNKQAQPATTQPSQWQQQQSLTQQMLGQIGQGATLSNLISTFGHGLDLSKIVQLYSGASRYGAAKEDWAQQYLTDW